jgi:hypothetical protein
MDLMPTINNQLTEWEFELLAKSGNELFSKLIVQRVRVSDRNTVTGEDFLESVMDYLEINVNKQYYFRKGYRTGTVYFECPIELENFQRMLSVSFGK